MKFRNAVMTLGLSMIAAGSAGAQTRGPELTLGLASIGMETYDGDASYVQVFAPATMLRMAFYLSPRMAIEPQVMLDAWSGEDESSTTIGLGAFLPIYFNADQGATGFYLSPGAGITMYSTKESDGDKASASQIFLAGEFGKKFKMGDNASLRLAAQYLQELENDDFFEFRNIGVVAGVSIFLK